MENYKLTEKEISELKRIAASGNVFPNDLAIIWEIHLNLFGIYPKDKSCSTCIKDAFQKCKEQMLIYINSPEYIINKT